LSQWSFFLCFTVPGAINGAAARGAPRVGDKDSCGGSGVENLLLSDLASANTSGMGRLGRGDLALSRDSLMTLSQELCLGCSVSASMAAGISWIGKGDGLEHPHCSLLLCSSGWKENLVLGITPSVSLYKMF
jgi:hypothetical protein